MLDPVVKEPRAPFPYFGGKRNAAQDVWDTLGDVGHYVEPFCGSCAILLARPRTHRGTVETVNDADGMLVNAWRSMRDDPDGVAKVCADPVMEIELHARLAFVKERMTPDFTAWMEGGPDHHDTRLAGYWIYATCASIGTCWNDDGPWRVVGGKLVKTREIWGGGRGIARELPHLSTAGSGLLGSCRTFLADGASCARESAFRRNRARTTALGRRGAGHQPGGPCARAECNRIAGGVFADGWGRGTGNGASVPICGRLRPGCLESESVAGTGGGWWRRKASSTQDSRRRESSSTRLIRCRRTSTRKGRMFLRMCGNGARAHQRTQRSFCAGSPTTTTICWRWGGGRFAEGPVEAGTGRCRRERGSDCGFPRRASGRNRFSIFRAVWGWRMPTRKHRNDEEI